MISISYQKGMCVIWTTLMGLNNPSRIKFLLNKLIQDEIITWF